MQQPALVPTPVAHSSPQRTRRLIALATAAVLSIVLAAAVVLGVQSSLAALALPPIPGNEIRGGSGGSGGPAMAPPGDGPFLPSADDGHVPAGGVTLADDVPAITRLDPALLDAMRQAEQDASADGIPSFAVSSGWRSEQYQRWLFADAVDRYGSEEIARQYVATPERSRHVTGDAVDIGSADAQTWLIEHGSRYGLCQTYANERWHFERATEPGGECPAMKADAAS